jgi:hypothetical protein
MKDKFCKMFSYEKRINPKWIGDTYAITLFGKEFCLKLENNECTFFTKQFYFHSMPLEPWSNDFFYQILLTHKNYIIFSANRVRRPYNWLHYKGWSLFSDLKLVNKICLYLMAR